MNPTRREFVKGGLASLGFLALPGGLFAPLLGHPLRGQPSAGGYAPAGWKPKGKKLFKNVFFSGVNSGIGHEPNRGVTTVDVLQSQLPAGKTLTIAVRPISSLGTKGKAIATKYKA